MDGYILQWLHFTWAQCFHTQTVPHSTRPAVLGVGRLSFVGDFNFHSRYAGHSSFSHGVLSRPIACFSRPECRVALWGLWSHLCAHSHVTALLSQNLLLLLLSLLYLSFLVCPSGLFIHGLTVHSALHTGVEPVTFFLFFFLSLVASFEGEMYVSATSRSPTNTTEPKNFWRTHDE